MSQPFQYTGPYNSTRRSLRAFPITDTELNVIAALAIMGILHSACN